MAWTDIAKHKKSVHLYHRGGQCQAWKWGVFHVFLRLSLLTEMGQRARIFLSETLWLPLLRCLGTGLLRIVTNDSNIVTNDSLCFCLDLQLIWKILRNGGRRMSMILEIWESGSILLCIKEYSDVTVFNFYFNLLKMYKFARCKVNYIIYYTI